MRATTTLQRTLAQVTVGTHLAMRARDDRAMHYELAEREQQFQYPISGTVGLVPVEVKIKVLFDIAFLYEYGYRRDSQLLEPLTRFGFTSLSAPPGTFPYAHVQTWIQDEDLNYVGAHVIVGVHNPVVAATGAASLTSAKFKGTLHCSFQGYGSPIDPDQPSDNPSTGGSSALGGAGGGGPVTPPTVLVAPAIFPPGPLGGAGGWTIVRTYPTGVISDFAVPAGEAALTINGAGLVTARDRNELRWTLPTITGAPGVGLSPVVAAGQPGVVPGTYSGDKYAANWIAPGRVGDQYKARWHMMLKDYGSLDAIYAVTLNMRDRQRGLAFVWGPVACGWVTDLRVLGNVQAESGHGEHGQGGATGLANQSPNALTTFGADPVALDTAKRALQTAAPTEAWVEIWRNGNYVIAGVYYADPDSGARPAYEDAISVATSSDYGPGAQAYFGFTRAQFNTSNGAGPGINGSDAHNQQGVAAITLYKR